MALDRVSGVAWRLEPQLLFAAHAPIPSTPVGRPLLGRVALLPDRPEAMIVTGGWPGGGSSGEPPVTDPILWLIDRYGKPRSAWMFPKGELIDIRSCAFGYFLQTSTFFYALDRNGKPLFKKKTLDVLDCCMVDTSKQGHFCCEYDGENGNYLFTAIPWPEALRKRAR